MSEEELSGEDESSDTLMPLAGHIIQQLTAEKRKNPSKFASFWEMDEDDIDEPSWEEIQSDPKLKTLWAAEKGEVETLQQLLSDDASLALARDPDGYTPLHRASYENHLQCAKMLVEAGAEVNAQTIDGWTPLHSASNWGQHEVASYLLHHGAEVNAQTHGLQTPLHLAASSTHAQSEQILQLLLMHPGIDYSLKNKLGETAQVVANRCSKYAYLFEMCEDSVSKLS